MLVSITMRVHTHRYLQAADFVFFSMFLFDSLSGVIAAGLSKYWHYDVFNKIDLVTSFLFILDLALRSFGFSYRCLIHV